MRRGLFRAVLHKLRVLPEELNINVGRGLSSRLHLFSGIIARLMNFVIDFLADLFCFL